jgi:hypothetical protein
VGAATWFATDFSLAAIDARREAGMLPLERQIRDERLSEGWVEHKRSDPSGFMERLLRATEYLIDIDDSALPKADRIEHYHRVILVAVLITDPDVFDDVPQISSALGVDRAHWPTAKALTVGSDEHELDRFWAREWVFDPSVPKWAPFQPLAERALEVIAASSAATAAAVGQTPAGTHPDARPTTTPPSNPPEVPPSVWAVLDETERAVIRSLIAATKAGRGRTLAQLVQDTGVAEEATISKAIRRMLDQGFELPNRHNSSGYAFGSAPSKIRSKKKR